MNSPRALFLSISFDPEPGAIRGLPLARWLRDNAGYQVEALTAIPWYPLGRFYPGYRFRLIQREEMDGITVWRVPLIPSHDSSAVRRMLTYISFMVSAMLLGLGRVQRPDVIYYFDNLPTTGLVARVLARLTGARTVQHIADLWPEAVMQSGMLRPRIVGKYAERAIDSWCRALYRRHARITVLSPHFKRVLVERGVPESKVEVIYNWADEDRFYPVPRKPELLDRLGLQGKFNVVYAGNMGPLQDLTVILDAAEQLPDGADVQFILAGSGPTEPLLRAEAARRNLLNVRFLGRIPLDEMNDLNSAADALLVHLKNDPAMHGTIPSKLQVSLACGRPVLLGTGGDAAELLKESGAGVVFTPGSGTELAQAVRTLAALSEREREAMGKRGREFYEREFSLHRGAGQTHAALEAALIA